MAEAWRSGDVAMWPKTAAWSRGLQRRVGHAGLLDGRPLVFVQSLPAFQLDGVPYVVITDRVAQEGKAQAGIAAARLSPRWLERERRFLKDALGVLVMGPSTQRWLNEKYGLPSERVKVVGAGPNFELTPRQRCATQPTNLLFVGTQWELKGGPELLEAFARLRSKNPHVTLTLAGSAPPGPLPAGVVSLGRVGHERMNEIYEAADVLVLPTRSEAFGIAFVEALIKGMPCVGTNIANIPWITASAAVLVDPGDPKALESAIEEVLSSYPAFSSAARKRGEELAAHYSWDSVASETLSLLGIASERNGIAPYGYQ